MPADHELTTDQRIVEAACAAPQDCGVTGWATVRWAGGVWFNDTLPDGAVRPITVAVGSREMRTPAGLVLSQERLGKSELVIIDRLRHTEVARAVVFEMRYAASVWAAVRVLDMACFNDLVSIDEVRLLLRIMNGWTGIQRARDAVLLADENSWSPTETTTRLIGEVLAGLPRLLSNRPVFDLTGRLLAVPDLLDLEAEVAYEYNGAVHQSDVVRRRDRDRGERLDRVAIKSVVIMAGDTPTDVASRMSAEHERGLARRTPGSRAWTIEPPPWWVPTSTVAQRRALSPGQRRRLLAHRQGHG